MNVEVFKRASTLYQSAFHPDTGELQNFVGRMSFQVPGGMLLTGAMMAFYKSTPAVLFWQWANQSFNAMVNYTNRSASSELTTTQIGVSYSSATTAALTTALGLKHLLTGSVRFAFLQRYVPFMAVAAANVVNIPLMRQSELQSGVTLHDDANKPLVKSKISAATGISQVVLSRIIMAAPGMLLIPLIMSRTEKARWFRGAYSMPMQVLLCGVSLTLMVPLACSLFDQKCAISTSTLQALEPATYEHLSRQYDGNPPHKLYFNKGL